MSPMDEIIFYDFKGALNYVKYNVSSMNEIILLINFILFN